MIDYICMSSVAAGRGKGEKRKKKRKKERDGGKSDRSFVKGEEREKKKT